MTYRKVILVELDFRERRWSASALEAELMHAMSERRPVVFGSISATEVDGAYRKLRQLARETETDDTLSNRMHSADKALAFFQDMLPNRFWKWFEIGIPQDRRKKLFHDQ